KHAAGDSTAADVEGYAERQHDSRESRVRDHAAACRMPPAVGPSTRRRGTESDIPYGMQISNRREGDVATSAEQEFVARPLDTKAMASDEKTRTRRVVLLRIAALAAVIVLLTIAAYRLGWFDLRRATATVERLQSGRYRLSVSVLF